VTSFGQPLAEKRGNWFGGTLAIGDFEGDNRPDLAVGAPGVKLAAPHQGVVFAVYYPGKPLPLDDWMLTP
jgi:hypothetical protein